MTYKDVFRRRNWPVAGVLCILTGIVHAQDSAGPAGDAQRKVSLIPRFSSTVTVSDNLQPGSQIKDGGGIVLLSPGLRLTSNSGRVKGFLDYALTGVAYVKSTAKDGFQNALNANLAVEAIENWAYVDLRSSITQQAISAFGVQTADNALSNANRSEVWNLNVSPYVRGNLAGVASYEARINFAETNTRHSTVGDNSTRGLKLSLGGLSPRTLLNWSVNASAQSVDFKQGRQTEDNLVQGALKITATDDLQLSVNGGAESNNFISVDQERHSIYGLGATWTPTERTKLLAQADHRFFGNGHNFSFEHRFARSIWRISDSKMVSSDPNQLNAVNLGTNYSLFYSMFASLEPDPVKRDALVTSYLQANGINPSAVAIARFLTSAVSLVRRQEISYALSGVRDTVAVLANRTETSRLDSLANVPDSLSNSNLVIQRGISFALTHKLTPKSTINLTLSQQKTTGNLSNQASTLKSILANWSTNLGARTQFSLGARYMDYSAALNSYKEKALFSNLTRQF